MYEAEGWESEKSDLYTLLLKRFSLSKMAAIQILKVKKKTLKLL